MEIVSLKGMVDIMPPIYSKEVAKMKIDADLKTISNVSWEAFYFVPKMNPMMLRFEKMWGKKRKDFNIFEKEIVNKELEKIYEEEYKGE